MPKSPRRRGTRSCYMGGCDHPECREAQRVYLADYYQVAKPFLGMVPHVDSTPAMTHLKTLMAGGMGYDAIAAAAGLQKNTIRYIALGRRPNGIRPDTARRILEVTLRPEWVDATGTRRRLQALAVAGYPFDKVAAEIGMHSRTVSRIACARHDTVRRDTAERVELLCEKWVMSRGPSTRVRGYAIAKGWAPILAWDDDTINDPAAAPVGIRTGRGRGERELDLDLDEWFRLVRLGEQPARAAQRCGVTLNAVEASARRHGRRSEYYATKNTGAA